MTSNLFQTSFARAALLAALPATSGCMEDPMLDSESSDVVVAGHPYHEVENYTPDPGSPFGVGFVNYYKGAVGILYGTSGGACTGTLIGRDLFLTAAHCPHDGTVDFNFEYVGNTTTDAPSDIYHVTGVVECGYQSLCGSFYNLRAIATANQRDFAVLRLGTNTAFRLPGDVHGWRLLGTPDPAQLLATGAPVALIQHPLAEEKKVSTGNINKWDGVNIQHTASMDHGSSGSSLLDLTGRAIALNDATNEITDNYGPAMRDIYNDSTVLKGPLTGNTYQLIHAADGLCLDVPGAYKGVTQVADNVCKTSGYLANQEVELVARSSGYTVVDHDSQLCLGLASWTPVNGTAVQQTQCNGSTLQGWDVIQTGTDGTVRSFVLRSQLDQTKCLYPDASRWLRAGACTSAAYWMFAVTPRSYKLTLDASGDCLDMPGYSIADGVTPYAHPCKADVTDVFNQEWLVSPLPDGSVTIANAYSQKCLDTGGSTTEASLVGQHACSGSAGQRFTLVAQTATAVTLRNPTSGKCLDLYGGPLRQHACGASPATQAFRLTKGIN